MIDLHCHVLPGIDDGAASVEEALRLARMAAADGCEVLVATPHQRHPAWENLDRDKLIRLCGELSERLEGRPRILPGAEIRVDDELLADLDRFPESGILPLAGSRYLLLELDRHRPHPALEELVHELCLGGWVPVLAHPELYPWLLAQGDRIERLVASGLRLQITAQCLTDGISRRLQTICHDLIDAGWVHFVASDFHNPDRRPPGLAAAYRAISTVWGESSARLLTVDHPAAVLADRPLRVAPLVSTP